MEKCKHATVASESGSPSRPPQDLMGHKVFHRCRFGLEVELSDVGAEPPLSDQFEKPEPKEEPENTVGDDKCTKTLFGDCSDYDPRSDPEVSVNIKANNDFWVNDKGYWVGSLKVFDNLCKIRNRKPWLPTSSRIPFSIYRPRLPTWSIVPLWTLVSMNTGTLFIPRPTQPFVPMLSLRIR